MSEPTTPGAESAPDYVRTVPYRTARLSYQFMLPRMVTRLWVYLFGEHDTEAVTAAVELLRTKGDIARLLIESPTAPLHTLYKRLIELEQIEDQNLGEIAMAWLDTPDNLHLRVMTADEEDAAEDAPPVEPIPMLGVPQLEDGLLTAGIAEDTPVDALEQHVDLPELPATQEQTWAKIKLNGDIGPPAASKTSLFWDPDWHLKP